MLDSGPALACASCAHVDMERLPLPHPSQSVLSDGRIVEKPLAKAFCWTCGLVAHASPMTRDQVRCSYDDAYDLAVETAASDLARASAYAEVVAELVGDRTVERVLEVGCGAGHTLLALSERWRAARLDGLEAAPLLVRTDSGSDKISIRQGFAEDLARPAQPYDLVFSINVIEHALDPAAFMAALERQLSDDGVVIVICPRPEPPNLELLFHDHIHSLSTTAFAHFAQRAGLGIVRHLPSHRALGNFQAFVLQREVQANAAALRDRGKPSPESYTAFARYLDAWSRLDDQLLDRAAPFDRIGFFGAGEFAALLRAYAPGIWDRGDRLIVDDVKGARKLGRSIECLDDVEPDGATALILAVHPSVHPALTTRLQGLGHQTIAFDDLIEK